MKQSTSNAKTAAKNEPLLENRAIAIASAVLKHPDAVAALAAVLAYEGLNPFDHGLTKEDIANAAKNCTSNGMDSLSRASSSMLMNGTAGNTVWAEAVTSPGASSLARADNHYDAIWLSGASDKELMLWTERGAASPSSEDIKQCAFKRPGVFASPAMAAILADALPDGSFTESMAAFSKAAELNPHFADLVSAFAEKHPRCAAEFMDAFAGERQWKCAAALASKTTPTTSAAAIAFSDTAPDAELMRSAIAKTGIVCIDVWKAADIAFPSKDGVRHATLPVPEEMFNSEIPLSLADLASFWEILGADDGAAKAVRQAADSSGQTSSDSAVFLARLAADTDGQDADSKAVAAALSGMEIFRETEPHQPAAAKSKKSIKV